MRTSAMAQQFLATFAQEILSPKHQNKLNEALNILSGKIQIVNGFSVQQDVEYRQGHTNNSYQADHEMIKLLEGVEEGEAPEGNLEEPRHVFFFQETIPGYQTLLLAKNKDYHLTNSSPAFNCFIMPSNIVFTPPQRASLHSLTSKFTHQ
ncbi:hypothetical protein PCASD_25060 [Puccinia coronata f. sp. avenae]|uniref:Uncharacterized protein n=1 Tax=Puccinia coronata f. sp. avenae TaxID=200324 RepID=A0A2N5TH76_9BASI|nr:hypothetical protein PCASD_25060 [Puccinia coronata f. sp. avenae]